MRATSAQVREVLRRRVGEIAMLQAKSFNAEVTLTWEVGYPATINDETAVRQATASIVQHFREEALAQIDVPLMFSEDFSFMLERVPGAYVLIGNGDGSGLHTATYEFNDDIIERGANFFFGLAKDHFSP